MEGDMDLDVLKLIVVLIAFLFLNLKARPRISTVNYWIMNVGLFLLLFSSLLDSTDGIKALENVPILGRGDPLHDIIEDQFSNIPGFALFALGAFRQMLNK